MKWSVEYGNSSLNARNSIFYIVVIIEWENLFGSFSGQRQLSPAANITVQTL